MPTETLCKIVRQYNREPVPSPVMEQLREIADDYGKVKNHVYQRYGGIGGLSKIYPGYTVQNEMTAGGMRQQLGLPSVYFYLAIFEALKDIRNQWERTKAAVLKKVNANERLSEEEKHFIRYVLKVSNAFTACMDGSPLELPKEIRQQYDTLASCVDVKKLENYLRRQVRACHEKLRVNRAEGFSVAERAYRYKDHGIYISVKEKRKRVFIPLTDGNCYMRQIRIRLFPERGDVELLIPVDVSVKKHDDYGESVGISLGMRTMLVTDQGNLYGEEFGAYQAKLSDWLRKQNRIYSQNGKANPGRRKYQDQKHRLEEQLHGYINQELNRFLRTEKPEVVYLPRLPRPKPSGPSKRMNYLNTTWQRGYIRKRLSQKCQEQSVRLVEVFGKDISNVCSDCGAMGKCAGDPFFCPHCGYEADRKMNAARNAKKRGVNECDPEARS